MMDAEPKRKRYYTQKYKKEWEQHPSLSDWITQRSNSDVGAYCTCCEIDLVGSVTVFFKHAKTKKHQLRMAQMKGEMLDEVADIIDNAETVEEHGQEVELGIMKEDVNTRTVSSPDKTSNGIDLTLDQSMKREKFRDSGRISYDPPSNHCLQGGFFNNTLRRWQSDGTEMNAWNLMLPIFICDDAENVQVIPSLPGVSRYGCNTLVDMLIPHVNNGLTSVFLVGAISLHEKDSKGTLSNSASNPVITAISRIKDTFPHITVACDVCLCNYTSHGHCCIIEPNGKIDREATIERLCLQALAYVFAGADIISPSDMMDGRVLALKNALKSQGMGGKVSILSNAVKFSSSLYEPFREAAMCASQSQACDRKTYELPPGSAGLALRAVERDIKEGADMVMVTPANTYLDVISQINEKFGSFPIFAFQASGEYAMLQRAGEVGLFDLKRTVMETLISMRRAGAEVIITFFAPLVLEWMKDKEVIIIRF